MARNFHFEYGTARAWGSFGYAIGAFFAGIFFSISPHINFWLVSLFGAVFMMINMCFKDKDHQCVAADAGGVKKEDFIAVFKDRNFWVFVIFIVGTWSFYNIFDQQLFPVFYAGLFESHDVGTRLYGYLNSFQVVLEALCMAIIPFFVNRVGPKNALLIGVVIMALRILSCALFVKLAETIRSNQAGEALQARGQNLSYQSAMTGHNIAAQRLALDQQEFGFKMQQAQEKAQQLISEAPKLSVNMEKGIETAVNNATASSNSANSMSALAQQFRAEKPTTGLFGNAQNMFAKLTGSDTTLRDLRIRQNALVNSQVLKFLPPGPATDKDVEIVRQGAPTDMDNPETVARWLDAMANLERRNAQFNEFKAEWMSANGNPGQSRNGGQILGLDVKKGESLGSAVKRYMSLNTDAAPAQDSIPSGEPRNQVGSYTSKSGIQFTVE